MADERRKFERVNIPRVLVKISTPERLRVAYLRDLSEGGVFIKTDKPLAVGRELEIDLLPPGKTEPIRLRGTVVRTLTDEAAKKAGNVGFGVKFGDIGAEAQAAVNALLDEYKDGGDSAEPEPADEASTPSLDAIELKVALEKIEQLSSALQSQEKELSAERKRRSELQDRMKLVAQELEHAKAQGGAAGGASSPALQSELDAARAETAELRLKLAEAEGDLEAFRQEVSTLEEDDAATRKIAETLAQAKAKTEAEAKRLRDEVATLKRNVDLAQATTGVRVTELQKELEQERERRMAAEQKVDGEQAIEARLAARVAELEQVVSNAREHIASMAQMTQELSVAKSRIITLEKTVESEKARAARAAAREREVRALLLAMKGDEVTVEDTGDSVTMPSTSDLDIDEDDEDSLGGSKSSPTLVAFMPSAIANAVAAAAEAKPVTFEVTTPPAPPPTDLGKVLFGDGENSSERRKAEISEESSVDIDVDSSWANLVGGGTPNGASSQGPTKTSLSAEAFLSRVHANDLIQRAPTFADARPGDAKEAKVMAILEVCDRYDSIKVLTRGEFTEEQLDSVLVDLQKRSLISLAH